MMCCGYCTLVDLCDNLYIFVVFVYNLYLYAAPTNTNCHINKVPRRRSAASREKKWENFQTTNNTGILADKLKL